MNIKPRLEAEAATLIEEHRKSGAGVHDLLAKHASEHGYNEETTRSLTWLVNRQNFKAAMSQDHKDEIEIADAEAVLFRMNRPKQASVKAAALEGPGIFEGRAMVGNSGAHVGHRAKVDAAPYLTAKLASRDKELDSQIKVLNAEMRERLFKLASLARNVKRAGLDATEGYRSMLAGYPEADRRVIDMVISESPEVKMAYADSQLRMLIPAALEDTKKIASLAASFNATCAKLAEAQACKGRVQVQSERMRAGWEV